MKVLCDIRDLLTKVYQLLVASSSTPSTDFEVKSLPPIKFCDGGLVYQVVICQYFEDNVLVNETTTILDPNGVVITALPATAEPCTDNELCDTAEESFLGDNATLALFDTITIFVPKCTNVSYRTSAGIINLPSQQGDWIYERNFNCSVDSYQILATGATSVNDITTILTKTK